MDQPTAQRKLYRSGSDKVIAGVCGGLGNFFDIDSTIVRIIFVLLTFGGGAGIIIYIILALIMPEQHNSDQDIKENIKNNAEQLASEIKTKANDLKEKYQREDGYRGDTRMWLGVLLLFFGLFFLVENFNIFPWFNMGKLWPVILIVIGLLIVSRGTRHGRR